MICPRCTVDNRDGARFCSHCRSELKLAPQTKHPTMRGSDRRPSGMRSVSGARIAAFFAPMGQLYNGDYLKAFVILGLYFFEFIAVFTLGGLAIGLVALFVTWIWAVGDARKVWRGDKEPW